MPKDWEVVLGVVGDDFFLILPKFVNWDTVLGTLGDAQEPHRISCVLSSDGRD